MDFFDQLVHSEIRLWNHLERHLSAEGAVSLAQWQALRAVRSHADTCRVQEVSEDLSITVGAASKLVDRLERDDLVVRRPHPADRRSALVSLTDRGSSVSDRAEALIAERLSVITEGLGGLAAATATLARLDEHVDQAEARS